jgi:uncharacterized protein YodC (DUF2158 family)
MPKTRAKGKTMINEEQKFEVGDLVKKRYGGTAPQTGVVVSAMAGSCHIAVRWFDGSFSYAHHAYIKIEAKAKQ